MITVDSERAPDGIGAGHGAGIRGVRRIWKSDLVERRPAFLSSADPDAASVWSLLFRAQRRPPGSWTSVVLVGPRPGGDWEGWVAWRDGALPDGWSVADRGHLLDDAVPILRFEDGQRRTVEVRRWHGWVDESEHSTAADADEAWQLARSALAEQWPDPPGEAVMLGSPAGTGRHLWQRTIPRLVTVPTVSADVAELIRSTTTQGRIETWSLPGSPETIRSLCTYDQRLAYLAVTAGLGVGDPVRSTGEPESLWGHGRSLVTIVSPDGWQHPGMVPVRTSDGWRWPLGRSTSWVDHVELWAALHAGWQVTAWHESMMWPRPRFDPLGPWTQRILAAHATLSDWTLTRHHSRSVLRQAQRVVRAIGVHGIGAFQGRPQRSTHRAPLVDAVVPAVATDVHVDGDDVVWTESSGGRSAAWSAGLSHPEWTSTIWARTRTRLATAPTGRRGQRAGFLHLDPGDLLGCRTDSLILRSDPLWGDDGSPGRYRRGVLPILFSTVPRPSTNTALDRLVRTCKEEQS